MNKPMTMGQRALYEIAVDSERCRNFLINLVGMQADLRRKNFHMATIAALAFLAGFFLGRV